MKALLEKEWVVLKLRPKIILANILLVFIPVIAMGTISYLIFSNAIETKSSNFYFISLLETDRKLNFALNEITTISSSAITQPVIQKTLKNPNTKPDYDAEQEINNLLIHHPMIDAFGLYSQDQLIYAYNESRLPLDVQQEAWYAEMVAAEGRPIWSVPGPSGTYSHDQPALVHARIVKDYYSLQDIGSIVITIKPELLEQVFYDTATMEQGNVLLVNQNGAIVYDKSGKHIGGRVSFSFLAEEKQDRNYYYDHYQGVDSLITYLPSHHPSWRLIAITPKNVLQAESVPIRNAAVLLGVFSLLSAILFDRMFVSRLVRSISNTVHGMRRVEQGIFTRISSRGRLGHDESDMLVNGFNKMSNQIEELLKRVELEQERKKQAEMQALVAQINPHFIYNSLESINSLAVLHGNKQISKMVIALGRLLRISISENQELVPLMKEFEHVKHYLDIQKFRFEDGFEYTLELPDHLQSCMTLKLIVQPIVENALYHAIEPMEQTGHIVIRATEQAQEIWIDIEDNGPGFDRKVLENFRIGSNEKKHQDSGVGLRNVHERIRIRFGSPYGMMICSSPGEGSIVRIRVPKLTWAEGEQSG